jgi:hypothetical protein
MSACNGCLLKLIFELLSLNDFGLRLISLYFSAYIKIHRLITYSKIHRLILVFMS